MGAGGIRMGGVFVEIGADAAKFFSTIGKVNQQIGKIGKSMVSAGGKLAGVGIGMAAPIAAAVKQGASFESTLLAIKASTGATSGEIDKIKASAMQMSEALGVGPTQATQGMLELLKAGMKVDQVLGGAGQAALEFAKVGEMDVSRAAVVMSDAMNVFGVSGTKAADTLSAAADASSTSIEQMAEAFSMSSAVAGLANQSIDDLSASLAILANNGVKGSDAGTSVKTMLMRLMAPADDAAAALAQVGLSTQSFRGADGKMRPMVEIVGTLNQAMQGLDQTAKDDVFRRIFGADAIRSASILSTAGVDGFNEMRTQMGSAMSVGDKFKVLMSGLAGTGLRLLAALERLAIAISGAVAPALAAISPLVIGFINGLTRFVSMNQGAVVGFAKLAVGIAAVGGAIIGIGYALQALSVSVSLVAKSFAFVTVLAGPIGVIALAIGAAGIAAWEFKDQIGAAFSSVGTYAAGVAGVIGDTFGPAIADATAVFGDLYSTASTTFTGIYDAIVAGDLSKAMDILWAGLTAGWLRGVEALMSYVDPFVTVLQDMFTVLGAEIYKIWDTMWVKVGNGLNIAGAYLFGVFDNIINGLLKAWDVLEAGIRKAWVRVQGIFKGGKNVKSELEAIDEEMKSRASARESARPGVTGRLERAAKENATANEQLQQRNAAVDANTSQTLMDRQTTNDERAAARREETKSAEERLAALSASAAPTPAETKAIADEVAKKETPAEPPPPPPAPETASQGKVAGTFSSLNLGAAFGSSTAAERTAKATEEIAKNTRNMNGSDTVAA